MAEDLASAEVSVLVPAFQPLLVSPGTAVVNSIAYAQPGCLF